MGTQAGFYDYSRMSFTGHVVPDLRPHEVAEFMVGYYERDQGTDGEFRVVLHQFHSDKHLHAHLQVFADGIEAMQKLEDEKGFLSKLARYRHQGFENTQAFALFLINGVGLEDFSDKPLGSS